MNERLTNDLIEGPEPPHSELQHDQQEMMDRKWEYLEDVKNNLNEVFGVEYLPKEFVKEDVLPIRRKIREQVENENYVEELSGESRAEATKLAYLIAHFREERRPIEKTEIDEDGDISVTFKDGTGYRFNADERRLAEDMDRYFDSYRLARNAHKFRKNVKDAEEEVVKNNNETRNFFVTKDEKNNAIAKELNDVYGKLGFSQGEIVALVNLSEISEDDLQKVEVKKELTNVFQRFISGDKKKFAALSLALSAPAIMQGIAPKFLADAFRNEGVSLTSLSIYAMSSFVASFLMAGANGRFRNYLVKNFSKKEGFDQYVAQGLTTLPGEDVGKMGPEVIQNRVANARWGYDQIMKTIGFDVLPAASMFVTSFGMLLKESTALAVATSVNAGLVLAVQKYIENKGRFWEKIDKSRKAQEQMSKEVQGIVGAHMEMVLSGKKDDFGERLEVFLAEEKQAKTNQERFRDKEAVMRQVMRAVNMFSTGIVAYVSGGGFINALAYSPNMQESFDKAVTIRRDLREGLREIVQMDKMFNGYVEGEAQKEEMRVGAGSVESWDLKMEHVSLRAGTEGKEILSDINLDIPAGSIVSLSGASGAGKTTLLKVLSGYYHPTSGEVKLGDLNLENVKKSGKDSIYTRIAYLPQVPYVFDGTVRDNLKFGVLEDVADEEIADVLREVGLNERFSNLEETLRASRTNDATSSGGEKQRIGLARIILKMRKDKSRIVYLDEPTAAVNPGLKTQIGKIVNDEKKKNPDVTFIAISHDPQFLNALQGLREVAIEKGKIVQSQSEYDI